MSENFTAPRVTRIELIKTLRAVSKLVELVRTRPIDEAGANARLSFTLGIIGGLADQALAEVTENLTAISPS